MSVAETEVDYSTMEAGREMDALVAELVIGLPKDLISINGAIKVEGFNNLVREVDYYSTDIGDAWEVVEKLREQGWIVRVQEMPVNLPFLAGSGWDESEDRPINRRSYCGLFSNPVLEERLGNRRREVTVFADAAPLAICRAALKAMEEVSRAS